MSSIVEQPRYFVALIPPKPFYTEALALKQEVENRFNSKAALRSPPHITLQMPFRYKEQKEAKIFEALSSFGNDFPPFAINQQDFGFFEPRVIFINVERSAELEHMQKELLRHLRKTLNIESSNYKNRGFHPHMTIAFRDLKKEAFYEAREHFSSKELNWNWTATELALLKHNEKLWEVLKTFPLRD
ncbi:MAG: 2'-5' RNA ligase family protein [Cyclobacteriaceae bacterium]